ncbi:hypothetical protein SASPL_121856 [Salvia splendens]|uniref:Uncharacterized protein n=1 Tax=Salvia splendens TaxID=180675 RepID=A0A8X8XVK2_SALSN|nr:hypothetical protein SASPL_121856 [Salvia splendens]
MLSKIFGNKKSSDIPKVSTQGRHVTALAGSGQRQSRALKIVHAGGHVERYYMATPAAMIIQKNPSFVLARPEIFRRPWDSVIRPEEILVPGQKYYVVPRRTVKKLRRRIRKPSAMGPGFTSTENPSQSSLSSFSGILVKPGIKTKARNLHVWFSGIESNNKKDSSNTASNPSGNKSENKSSNGSKQRYEKKEMARIESAWEPGLQSITE